MFSDAALIVFIIRLLVPLLMFRFPLLGGVLSFLLDGFDGMLSRYLGGPIWSNYQFVDKLLDLYYLTIMFLVLTRYISNTRTIGVVLYAYRFVGVVLLFIVNVREIMILFPNVFELWFFTWVALAKYRPSYVPTKKVIVRVLIVFFVIKIMHEFLLHGIGICTANYWCGLELLFPNMVAY
jgi:hypothetical protein